VRGAGALPNCDAYSFTRGTGLAWVVAMNANGADHDLVLYDDYVDSRNGLSNERARSARAADSTEIVVGAADADPLTVYPCVIRGAAATGDHAYSVTAGDATGRVDEDGEAYWGGESLTAGELARVYQVRLEAGTGYPISVWRAAGTSTVAFAVFPATPAGVFALPQALVRSHPVAGQEQAAAWFSPAVSGDYLIAVFLEDLQGPPPHESRYRLAVGSQAVEVEGNAPALAVAGAAPNPASGATRLRWSLGAPGRVRLAIYDVGGRRVRTLVDGARGAGAGEAPWDLLDEDGRAVAPGVYWARFEAAGLARTSRVAVVR
jgi:hypothetical protein